MNPLQLFESEIKAMSFLRGLGFTRIAVNRRNSLRKKGARPGGRIRIGWYDMTAYLDGELYYFELKYSGFPRNSASFVFIMYNQERLMEEKRSYVIFMFEPNATVMKHASFLQRWVDRAKTDWYGLEKFSVRARDFDMMLELPFDLDIFAKMYQMEESDVS
jgi:hypothetical protein